jgi:hypothetical protein
VWRSDLPPPNTRVQRTRSSPSAPRSPLTRHPLGRLVVRSVDMVSRMTVGELVTLAIVLCLQAGTVVAVPNMADHAFLDRLSGSWILRGTLAGKVTTHDVRGTWILDGLYLELHERSRETDSKGKPLYEAVVLLSIDEAAGEYQCLWLDSTGGGGLTPAAFGRAKRAGDSIPFLFRASDGTISFSNVFSYDAASEGWTWQLDNVRKDGTYVPFGRVRLSRR